MKAQTFAFLLAFHAFSGIINFNRKERYFSIFFGLFDQKLFKESRNWMKKTKKREQEMDFPL